MPNTARTHSNVLDGLRGLAAISVIFSHVFLLYYSEAHYGPDAESVSGIAMGLFNSPVTFFYRGGAAVMLFFLLSGYVLTSACIKKAPADPTYVRTAASKRYLRLGLPVAAAVGIGYLVIALKLFPSAPQDVSPFLDFPDPDLGFLQMVRSALYGSMLFGDGRFDYVLWTISIEFYGSLLVFALYAVAGSTKRLSQLLGVGTGAVLLLLPRPFSVYSLFFFGAALAHTDFSRLRRLTSHRHGFAGLILATAAGCYLAGYYETSVSYAWLAPATGVLQQISSQVDTSVVYPTVGSVLILGAVLAGMNHRRTTDSTGNRLLGWLGKLSFSVYLLHPLVLATAGKAIFMHLGRNTLSLTACLITVFSITYLASHFFYRHVDRPSTQLANQFGQRLYTPQAA